MLRILPVLGLSLSTLCALVSPAYAQPVVPVGNELQLNEYTTSSQREPRIVYDGVDGFVVVWQSFDQDGSQDAVVARRLDGEGSPSGSEFLVNSYTTGRQGVPELTADGSGGFAVVFQNQGGTIDDPNSPISLRAFDSGDQPLFDDLQVNTTTTGDQAQPSVVRTPSGDFLVSFDDDSPGLADEAVRIRRIDAAGVGVGADLEIQEQLAVGFYETPISSDGGDGFVVVWTTDYAGGTDLQPSSIRARRLDSAGQPVGASFQVNSHTTNDQYDAFVSPDGSGGFVVSWVSDPIDGGATDYDIVARRFQSDGTPRGFDFKVSTDSTPGSFRQRPRSVADSEGGFLVVWEDYGGSEPGSEVFARRVNSAGVPVGDALQVNAYTTSSQQSASVAATPTGEFLVVWQSSGSFGTDTSSSSVQARRLAFDHDEDGVGNPVDNCPDDANADQADGDSDTVGDVCDLCLGDDATGDADGDGVCNDQDLCLGDDAGGDADGDGLCAGSPFECDDMDPTNACAAVFDDGFESGDTTVWSVTVG